MFAALLLAGGELSISVAGAGPAHSPAAPGDLLSDGYDALGANRPDLARKIFQTLLNAYPQSTEAATAADELADLEPDGDGGAGAADEAPAAAPPTQAAVRPAQASTQPPARAVPPRSAAPARSAEQLNKARRHFLIEAGDRVFFAENSDSLGGRSRAIVEAQARWLKGVEGLEVTIIGRAADGGSAADNKALSLARAHAVEAKLIEAGIDASRIRVEGRGSADPVATCTSPMCEAQNRHAESLLHYQGSEGAQISSAGGALVRDETQGQPHKPSAR